MKQICGLLALVLLLGAGAPAGTAAKIQPAPAETAAVRLWNEGETLPAFAPAEHKGAFFAARVAVDEEPYYIAETLSVAKDGSAALTHDGVTYRLIPDGGALRLEKDLYAAPFDSAPARTLDAGTVRLCGDGGKVNIEVAADPLGIFADFGELPTLSAISDDLRAQYAETASENEGFAPPFQPNTEWLESAAHPMDDGFVWFGNIGLHVNADSSVSGTMRETVFSEAEDCALLWASDAAALVRPDGELLFYGAEIKGEEERDRCVRYVLRANYDPHALGTGQRLTLNKTIGFANSPEAVMGRSALQILADFAESGWTRELLQGGEEYGYDDLLLRLTKDGRTLLIYLGQGYRYGSERYAYAYVLTDAAGKLESWGGTRPGDHTRLDGFRKKDRFPFETAGFCGLGEDDNVLLLDDGTALVTYWDESGKLESFEVLGK